MAKSSRKTCPIGLICFDTKYIIFLFIIIILFFVYYIHTQNKNNLTSPFYSPNNSKSIINDVDNGEEENYNTNRQNVNRQKQNQNVNRQKQNQNVNRQKQNQNNQQVECKPEIKKVVVQTQDSYLVNKDYERVINPLLPPERRNQYIDPNSTVMVTPGVPINIPTRGYTGGSQQIGALYKQGASDSTIKIGDNNEPVILPLFGMPTYNGSNKWMYYTATDKFNQVKLPITNKNRECNLDQGCEELYDGDIVTIPAYNGNFKVNKYQFDKPRYIPHIL
jgi:hypothetical protein